ncbi:hypothetical protein EJP02_217 [Escherichia phage EJP2]|nr:hypothetical protein EJP02_217 [Escherichia phage EJP2]
MTSNELQLALSDLDNVCYSGGAKGADRLFGIWATENGFQEVHFSFKKHNYVVDESTIIEIPDSILQDSTVIDKLKKANYSLGRSIPKKGSYVYNLLARNTFQVLLTERVYCISPLASPTTVSGGTAWAVQMYIDQYENPVIYGYDPLRKEAYQYCNTKKEFITVDSVPAPTGKWTGIGSRETTENHMQAFVSYFRS